ncbi:MAG: exosortase [Deltaproteobacteria bacterium]|nr:MAG: exosortase [Deltaproteobacteria bacterium]
MHTTTQTHIAKLWLPLSVLVLSFAALYHHVLYKLALDWITDDNYSHGSFIPIIAAYLVWQRRERLSNLQVQPSNLGLIILLAGLIIFFIANIGAELFTMRFSMLIIIWGLIIFLLGLEFAKATLLPVLYLIFMIPLPAIIWNKIAFPLKLFVTKMAIGTITLLHIPAYREGNIIHLSNTTLQVVDACSGMRSLASLLALSAAFAFITRHSKTKKWILFISAVPIAVLLNIFRLSATAMLAQHYGPQVAQGFLHELSGIVVFMIAMAILYCCHLLLEKA